jgi:hypothetical protein
VTAAPPHGFSSETLAFEAVAARDGDDTYHVYYLGDCDRAGHDAARALEEKLTRFAHEEDIEVIFEQIAVTKEQVKQWGLPTREPNRKSAADKKWPYGPWLRRDARTIHLRLPEMTQVPRHAAPLSHD